MFRESLKIHIAQRGEEHVEVVDCLQNLGSAQLEQGHLSDAEGTFRRALALARKVVTESHPVVPENHPAMAVAMGNLTYALRMESNFDEAITLAREAVEWHRRNDGETNRATRSSSLQLADLLIEAGLCAEAEPLARRWVDLQKTESRSKTKSTMADVILGAALAGMNRFEEAEPLLTKGYEAIKDNFTPGSEQRRRDALNRIVKMYESWNAAKPDPAREERLRQWRVEVDRVASTAGP